MSILAMSAVWQHATEATGNELVILLALADWANDEGVSWHSVEHLAEKAHVSERTVHYVLPRLVELGYLEIERGGQDGRRTNRYYVQVANLLSGVQNLHPTGAGVDTPRVQTVAPDTKDIPNTNQMLPAPIAHAHVSEILLAIRKADPNLRWVFSGKKKPTARGSKAPDAVIAAEAALEWAKSKGWVEAGILEDVQLSAEAALEYYRGTGKRHDDWGAALDTWIRKDILNGVDEQRLRKRAHIAGNVQRGGKRWT